MACFGYNLPVLVGSWFSPRREGSLVRVQTRRESQSFVLETLFSWGMVMFCALSFYLRAVSLQLSISSVMRLSM